jgi:high affinity Mn2+ porin
MRHRKATPNDSWLVYGKVGGAWAHVSVEAVATINSTAGGAIASVSSDKTSSGWMIGFGTEYALSNNWTAKIEYNMLDFSRDFISDSNVHVIKAGMNYRFGFSPGITAY